MTSVPKPLKFLRPHYAELSTIRDSWPDVPTPTLIATVASAVGLGSEQPAVSDKSLFADILSVLAMTYSDSGKRETLSYRLKGSEEDPGLWGHEYVRLVDFALDRRAVVRGFRELTRSTPFAPQQPLGRRTGRRIHCSTSQVRGHFRSSRLRSSPRSFPPHSQW